jgi:phosphohistidine phosphatase
MKRLLLCRHAKSSWKDGTLADIDRPLNSRGKRDAPVMGKRLASLDLRPELIVSSPAKRALSTARKLAKAVDYPKKHIVVKNEMYGATSDILLALVRGLGHSCNIACLVGHNPETTIFANELGGTDIYNVPTCGIVALEFTGNSWGDVGRKKGKLIFFDFP